MHGWLGSLVAPNGQAKIKALLLCFFLLAIWPIQPVLGSPDQITNGPTDYEDNTGGWFFPDQAYTSNNQRATCSKSSEKVTYKEWNFEDNITESDIIEEVSIGCEGYITGAGQGVSMRYSWNGGSTWSMVHNFALTTSETTKYIDTMSFDQPKDGWLPEHLTNENLRVRINYFSGGCYPNRTYFVTYDNSASMPWIIKNVEKLTTEDLLLCSNYWQGLFFNQVAEVEVHNGTWTIYIIESGHLLLKVGQQTIDLISRSHLTANHPCHVIREGEELNVTASEVQLGDLIKHIRHNVSMNGQVIPIENHKITLEAVENITTYEFTGLVYNVKTDNSQDRLFCKYLMDSEIELLESHGLQFGIIFDPETFSKWTGYVDYMPIQVTWTVGAEFLFIPWLIPKLFLGALILFVLVLAYNGKRKRKI